MNLDELFLSKLCELASAEKLLIAGLPVLVEAASDAELQASFAEHLEQTETQAAALVPLQIPQQG